MCEFNRYKDEILWCIPMNSPCVECVVRCPKMYDKIKEIAKEFDDYNQRLNHG